MDIPKPVFYFHRAGLTDTGMLRSHNEDAFKLPAHVDVVTLAARGYFYVLADGMGGHQKGEVASAVTIETANTAYYQATASLDDKDPQEAIIETMARAIEQANLEVMDATDGGGTTVVAATLYQDLLVVMNIGDSRAYLWRDNELHMVSRDHSLVSRLVELGKITAEEALNHPRQNVLYQALGQGTDLEIHVFTDRLKLGDTLLLCSDGLWGPIGDEAIKEVLVKEIPPAEALQELVDRANDAGGPDNITGILVSVSDEQSPDPDENEITQFPANGAELPASEAETPVERIKPATLPEGKYFRNNQTND